MPEQYRRILWLIVLMVVFASGTLALVIARTKGGSDRAATDAHPLSSSGFTMQSQESRPNNIHRNLSLQPEAFKLSRRLGQRFIGSRREVSVLIGTLIRGGEQQPVVMTRRQTNRGERVEIAVGVGTPSLTWSEREGPRSSGNSANETERTLIERLAFDSVDQFVLAQRRGASYYTVARNVRPAEAGDSDNYDGPLWDLVRVDYPQEDTPSRLYYINSTSGLIDKIVYEIGGEPIEANFSGWQEQGAETVPSRITWTREGQTLMEFRLTNFTHDSQP